jgi:hypothetical protein
VETSKREARVNTVLISGICEEIVDYPWDKAEYHGPGMLGWKLTTGLKVWWWCPTPTEAQKVAPGQSLAIWGQVCVVPETKDERRPNVFVSAKNVALLGGQDAEI